MDADSSNVAHDTTAIPQTKVSTDADLSGAKPQVLFFTTDDELATVVLIDRPRNEQFGAFRPVTGTTSVEHPSKEVLGMISNLRRYVGATVLAAVVAAGVSLMPATAQAQDFDVCAQIEDAIAAIENSSLPDRAKDRIIDQLERLADEYGCNEF